MTEPISPVPNLMAEDGRYLPIPPNVWLVGTANQDETTKDFVMKTYDRAHVMNMPRNRAEFDFEQKHPMKQPLGFEALEQAFEKAQEKHGSDADKSYDYLTEQFEEILEIGLKLDGGIDWKNKMKKYVPVVRVSGGTIGEATDHILATKLLRTIPKRHDNRPEDLNALKEEIQITWEELGDKSSASDSLHLINEELRRLGEEVS